jgi:hypothetical protein
MESIVSLILLTAVVTALAAWVATGSDRISNAGLQTAFAFYLCLFQGFEPHTDFVVIRDRVVGIIFGIVVVSAVFRVVWPEHAIEALRVTLARILRNLAKLLVLPQVGVSPEMTRPAIDKINNEIARGLDNSFLLAEVMIFEQGLQDDGAVFPPSRLECLMAHTQVLSLMTTVLLGKTKLEEWDALEKPVQESELVLRRNAAAQLEHIAASLENRSALKPVDLSPVFALWNQAAPPVTQNDRPRLIRRVVEQIGEMA